MEDACSSGCQGVSTAFLASGILMTIVTRQLQKQLQKPRFGDSRRASMFVGLEASRPEKPNPRHDTWDSRFCYRNRTLQTEHCQQQRRFKASSGGNTIVLAHSNSLEA